MSRHVTSCHVMSRHVISCYVISRRKSRDGHTTNASLSTDFFHTQSIQIKHDRVRWLSRRLPIQYRISGIWSSFFFFFYSTLVLRNYSTDSHKIFRNCVFWCSLNNPVVLKFFWRHLAEKNAKTAKIWSKFHGLTQIFDNNFKTVKDNSNLKQTWTRGIVSLHFWQISLRMVWGQLRSICPIGWQNLYFCQIATFSLLTQKLFNRFAQTLQINCVLWSRLDNPGD